MITLYVGNRTTRIDGAPRKVVRKLEKITSYLVEGFYFSPAFKAKRWDGREHLMKFSAKKGYTVPTGLAAVLAQWMANEGIRYSTVNETAIRNERQDIPFLLDLYDYQEEAVEAILSPPFPGRGILKMPTRSGKTRTTARLISRLGRPALFVVPSKHLLHQSAKALSEALRASVGKIGDGVFNPQTITVATMQTLTNLHGVRAANGKPGRPRDPRWKALARTWDVNIFDEVHHLKGGNTWHKVGYALDARYKVGLSATAFLDSETEQAKGAIWMLGICGPVRFDLGVSELVDRGYLMRQRVKLYTVDKPRKGGRGWSQRNFERCIIKNPWRNTMVAAIAKRYARKGLRVLVIARRLEHIELISERMMEMGLNVRVVVGRTQNQDREDAIEALANRWCDALVGNVLGEGVDIPEVEVVINAEGGKDDKATVQRQRNLTLSAGKTKAILVDFLDVMNPKFEEHSNMRREMYESEPAFSVEVVR